MFTPQQENHHMIKINREIGQTSTGKASSKDKGTVTTLGKGKEKAEDTFFLDMHQDA